MANKNVILQMKIEDILTDLMVKTGADNVVVNSETNETLATRLASIASQLNQSITSEAVAEQINTAIDDLINGAPAAYDTLKEISDYLETHADEYQALVALVDKKVDKVDGKGLSENDFTTILKNKLDSIAEGATKTAKSTTNGNILVNGEEVNVYTHPTGAGNNHLPAGGTVGQVLRAGGNGTGSWGENVRSGASAPGDLAAGELFVKIL